MLSFFVLAQSLHPAGKIVGMQQMLRSVSVCVYVCVYGYFWQLAA